MRQTFALNDGSDTYHTRGPLSFSVNVIKSIIHAIQSPISNAKR